MRKVILSALILGATMSYAQNYTSYFTGNTSDVSTIPQGGICLMGGATEEDEAIKWFLNRADGGDVLVLRASGSDGYNDYFYNQLGVTVNSVETIVFNDASASNEAYIQQKISQAEAIWFAGGDQWDYHSYWYNTPIQTEINQAIANGAVVGGTSAGMAILGGFRFTAENGTVTSATALSNPYDANVTLNWAPFIVTQNALEYTITDTHYDNPDRKGRHMVFMARSLDFTNMDVKGIACDEYTAVCIDENSLARVFGQYPTYDDNAYFLQINCELSNPYPEVISSVPLTWDHNGMAVKAYAVKGTLAGTNTFDLSDWMTGSGGEWQDWSVDNGVFMEAPGSAPDCNASLEETETQIDILPNPAQDFIEIKTDANSYSVSIFDLRGNVVLEDKNNPLRMNLLSLSEGTYWAQTNFEDGRTARRMFVVLR
ncbi:MAG: cyanophycinase [Fluviicola sp. XM-24bin1]|nr:MAG: cyanophycinase [Fluviicola sp. XM-24bin1]